MIIKENIEMQVDNRMGIIWLRIGSPFELHYSYKTICSFYDSLNIIGDTIRKENIKHLILLSANKQVWNMGGDLEMFSDSILHNREDLIKDYAYKCIEVLSSINKGFYYDVIVTSVIQGNAFGGGFECALSGSYIIAEEHTKFSFPEVLFGIYPGMGAYSFLTRKLGFAKASEMISSGKKWTAAEMHQLGLIDFVCESGKAIESIMNKIESSELTKEDCFKNICCQVPLSELREIVDLWIKSTLSLDKAQITVMKKIVRAQKLKNIRLSAS